jgi:hypothetical protein
MAFSRFASLRFIPALPISPHRVRIDAFTHHPRLLPASAESNVEPKQHRIGESDVAQSSKMWHKTTSFI